MDILREKLANGVYFSHIKNDKYKTARLSVNFVSQIDRKNVTERSLLMSMLRQDTLEFKDYSELNMVLSELYGASLYSDTAKIGDIHLLTVGSTFLNDSALPDGERVTYRMAEILNGVVFNPVCKEREFSKELLIVEKENLKEAILSEINDKKRYALKRAIEIYFENEPYSVPSDGIAEELDKITGQDLCHAYNDIVRSAAIEIVYDGNEDPEEIKKLFANSFSKISERDPVYPSNNPMKKRETITVNEKMDVLQAKEVMLFSAPSETDSAVLRVLSALYGGSPFSMLFKEVREKRSLCYYCSASFARSKNMIIVESGVDTSKISEAEKAILGELKKIAEGNFSDEELENTKQYLYGLYKTTEDSPSAFYSRYLSDIVLRSESFSKEAEKIIAVKREDVISAAAKTVLSEIYCLSAGGEE